MIILFSLKLFFFLHQFVVPLMCAVINCFLYVFLYGYNLGAEGQCSTWPGLSNVILEKVMIAVSVCLLEHFPYILNFFGDFKT